MLNFENCLLGPCCQQNGMTPALYALAGERAGEYFRAEEQRNVKNGKDPWDNFDHGHSYNWLEYVLGQSFQDFLFDNPGMQIFEPFSPGLQLRRLRDSGIVLGRSVALTLIDHSPQDDSIVKVVEGNVFTSRLLGDPNHWIHRVRAHLPDENPYFHMIISNPVGGWFVPIPGKNYGTLPLCPILQHTAINAFWSLLNPGGGILLLRTLAETFEERWINRLRSAGIDANTSDQTAGILILQRSPYDPDILPPMFTCEPLSIQK